MPQTGLPFTTDWRIVHDPEEIHQLRATGGGLYCPAILGGCGPSAKEPGRFWWHVKGTNCNESMRGYEDTIDAAKAKVAEGCAKYCQQHEDSAK